jgi:hypothetical protein
MVVDTVTNTQHTMVHTLCINVAWCCDELVSCVLRHFAMSTLLHCLMPTVRPFPLLAGRVPQLPRLPRWPPIPHGPRTPLPHRLLHVVSYVAICKRLILLIFFQVKNKPSEPIGAMLLFLRTVLS